MTSLFAVSTHRGVVTLTRQVERRHVLSTSDEQFFLSSASLPN